MSEMTSERCPRCGKELQCLAGCSAHPKNWYCEDEAGCGYQAWDRAHLAQPAQVVDVGAIAWGIFVVGGEQDGKLYDFADDEFQAKLRIHNHPVNDNAELRAGPLYTRALSGEKAGPMGDGCYYLQDSRSCTGNCPMWWAKDGKGYVTRLDGAHRYTFAEAMKQHRMRETDIPWACEYIDALRRPTVDIQHMRPIKDQIALLPASPAPDKEGK